MTLRGKGFYIWKIPYCEGGNPQAIAARAVNAGLSHVLIKIADGASWPYNVDLKRDLDLIPPVRDALKERGVEVWGWHYVRGDNPLNEAYLGIKRMRELHLDGYVVDAEAEYKAKGRALAAGRFMREIRRALPRTPIALSSYRYPRTHPDFPFDAFLEYCDYTMPQVYFEQAHNPEEQLERTVNQYMVLRNPRPVIPTAPAYARGEWRPTPHEIKRFFHKCREMGLTAANAWSWDFASRRAYVDLWNAVAEFDWPATPQSVDMPERLIGRWTQHDPSLVSELYADRAAHVTGERTVLGRQEVVHWYQRLFNELLPGALFELTGKFGSGHSRNFMRKATSESGVILDGNDTLGMLEDQILYHYTYFTVSPA